MFAIELNILYRYQKGKTDLSTSPVGCSHFTLGNPKKVIFNSIIHRSFWLFTLYQKKTKCIPLAPPVACPRCSTRAMQIIASTKQQ